MSTTGVTAYNEQGCDFIVSLGGGSSHDCAKGIGLVTAGGGHIRDYEGIDKSTVPMTPAYCHQHHGRYSVRDDTFLYYYQYRYPCKNGDCGLALHSTDCN